MATRKKTTKTATAKRGEPKSATKAEATEPIAATTTTVAKGKSPKRKPREPKPTAKASARAKATDSIATEPKSREAAVAGSLAALRDDFCAHLLTRGKSAGTARSYAADLKVAERHFGEDKLVAKLTRAEAEGYMSSALVTLGCSGESKNQITIDKVIRVFRQALDHAAEIGWIAASPMPPYERRSAKKAAADTATTTEEASHAEA